MTGRLAAESFKAALRHLLQARGHGARAGLANAGRKTASDIYTAYLKLIRSRVK